MFRDAETPIRRAFAVRWKNDREINEKNDIYRGENGIKTRGFGSKMRSDHRLTKIDFRIIEDNDYDKESF